MLRSLTPGLNYLTKRYSRRWLRADGIAGVAVAAYLIPQVMAYSAIVDVPPVASLWTALAAIVAYAVLGSSRILSSGPESTIALMTGVAIAPLAAQNPDRAVALSATLALIVAGWSAACSAAAGGDHRRTLVHPAARRLPGRRRRTDGRRPARQGDRDLLRGRHDRRGGTRFPRRRDRHRLADARHRREHAGGHPAAALAAPVAARPAHRGGAGHRGVGRVRTSSHTEWRWWARSLRGCPCPHLPEVTFDDVKMLLLAGLGITIVGYSDIMLIARGFPLTPAEGETAADLRPDPQAELVAMAGVHAMVGMFSGYPVSASGSRTALAIAGRARSQVYSLVAALCVVAVLFFAGPLMAPLPWAALGAVVLYAAGKLVSIPEFRRLWRFRRREFMLAVITLVGTVVDRHPARRRSSPSRSACSRCCYRLARPHEGVLGRVPGIAGMHDVADYPDARTIPGLHVLSL